MAKSNTFEFQTAYTRYANHVRFHSPVGDREKIEYKPVYNRAGEWHLEECGKHSVYDEIQSFADSCDLDVIMSRYRNGETDVLQQVQGTYGDISNIPRNYADILNAKLEAERLFMSLAPEIREKYNNSCEQFMAQLGTQEGLEKLGVSFDAPAAAPAAPVAESEVTE